MEIYLIRHTTPAVKKGICYGQTDLDITETFLQEADVIKNVLPSNINLVYSSPLQRCHKLAQQLFPNKNIILQHDLKEINCGTWEMQHWDDIPKHEIDPWMNDFVQVKIPQGESYIDLYERVTIAYNNIAANAMPVAIVAHGGVLRSILAYITNTQLVHSFDAFKLNYGCVVKIVSNNASVSHSILSNISTAIEQHKPTL
jgi:alpha-ribazole phosphatase